jgi:hypothetical protein
MEGYKWGNSGDCAWGAANALRPLFITPYL